MGLFDSFYPRAAKCPYCKEIIKEIQTKQFDCVMDGWKEREKVVYYRYRKESEVETKTKLDALAREYGNKVSENNSLLTFCGYLRKTNDIQAIITDGCYRETVDCLKCGKKFTAFIYIKNGIYRKTRVSKRLFHVQYME